MLDELWIKVKDKLKTKRIIVVAVNTVRNYSVFKVLKNFVGYQSNIKSEKKYIKKNFTKKEDFIKERTTVFKNNLKISILVPLYNTPKQFLSEMIESVLSQSFENWELCLADGSDNEHNYVEKTVKEYIKKDNRIIYKKLEKNLGIAENTNHCIKIATGDYIALFDHDDLLHESALFEVVKAINKTNADFIYTDEASFSGKITNIKSIHFKPDFSPDTLRSYNYICHLTVFSKALLQKVGYFSTDYDGSQDYDMVLRLTEKAQKIYHIPRVLYYWRIHKNSVAKNIGAKPYCTVSAKKALKAHLNRLSIDGEVEDAYKPTTYKINYKIHGTPLVSIIIPNKDHIDDLDKCIKSINEKSTYKNYELIIVENNSELDETFEYYKRIEQSDNIKVVFYDGVFNYSLINNFGFKYCKGDYILLLNNDMEVITPKWIEELLMFAQRKDVGAVGALLLYPDRIVQHAGVIIKLGGVAGHSHKGWIKELGGYFSRILISQNLSAVTGACLMVKKSIFEEVGGLDPNFAVAFNDVDFCLKLRQKGYLNIYTPYAELYHYESKSRGLEDTYEKQKRFKQEIFDFQKKWEAVLEKGDPYYNKNLTLKKEDFSIQA